MTLPSPLALCLASVIIFMSLAAISPLLARFGRAFIPLSFLISATGSVSAAAGGFMTVQAGTSETIVLPVGLPDLPFYLRLDPLAGFFITVVALLGFFISIYSIGYVKGFLGKRSVTPLVIFYSLFVAGMLLVMLSDDAYSFMMAWEMMAASSFFLVAFENERAEMRKAAFLYLIIAHIGAVLILLAFGVMAGFAAGFENFSGYTFQAMRGSQVHGGWATAAFLLAFFGFAAKAGVVPLHVWLPEAHPAAPSNVSALMSGAMLKTAVYGIIRLSFDLLHVTNWWWGGIILVLGLVSALMGILYAVMQNDIKRLLAYSSVENIGIILISLGLAVIFKSYGMNVLAALALLACFYHILNHAIFKGLLFMGAGAIVHATGERNINNMGGLIHKMPWTAPLFLVGCLSISALPPFNGFVSEWLTFQAFLLSPVLPGTLLNLLIPLGAALLALTAAMSARCFVKVFGVTFLGKWRGRHDTHIHEAGLSMRAGMAMAAAMCLFLGVLPTLVIDWIDILPETLTGAKIGATAGEFGWLWLTPVSAKRASYGAPIVFIGIAAVVAIVYLLSHARKTAIRRGPVWDCGFGRLNNRMQYNSVSFAMPLRRIFGYLLSVKETTRTTVPHGGRQGFFPEGFFYRLRIRDRFWYLIYEPLSNVSFYLARQAGRIQHGRIQIYILYSFITLILLLAFA